MTDRHKRGEFRDGSRLEDERCVGCGDGPRKYGEGYCDRCWAPPQSSFLIDQWEAKVAEMRARTRSRTRRSGKAQLPVLDQSVFDRDPCDGCDGTCGDVCPVLEAQRLTLERQRPVGTVSALALEAAHREASRARGEAYDLSQANQELRAENERLREALSWIYRYAGGWSGVTGDDAGHLTAVGMHAKEALGLARPADEVTR